jgi:hypothetical protein
MPTQMESGRPAAPTGPRPCTECKGSGEVVMGPACDGCGCGGRLHGVDVAVCPECEGSGREDGDECAPEEIWRPIPTYPYEVSNHGRLRRASSPPGGRTKAGKMLTPTRHSAGYLTVHIRDDDRSQRRLYVHRLVAAAFCEKPDAKSEVNHKNGIKTDNRAWNLEWVTRFENNAHAIRHGLIKPGRPGESNGRAILTEDAVRSIRKAHAEGFRPAETYRTHGITYNCYWQVIARRTWRHVA